MVERCWSSVLASTGGLFIFVGGVTWGAAFPAKCRKGSAGSEEHWATRGLQSKHFSAHVWCKLELAQTKEKWFCYVLVYSKLDRYCNYILLSDLVQSPHMNSLVSKLWNSIATKIFYN